MKRLIALAALLCAASACTTTTENANTGANTNNANAAATATPTPAGVSQADIEAKERQVWDALKAKNWDAFSGMLAEDFVIVRNDGVQTRAQMLEEIKKYDLTEYSFSDIRFVRVDPDLAIITYTATEKSSYDGRPMPSKPTRASSAWVNKGGKWVSAYHQETEVAETTPPPAGGANSNTAANANANAAANSNANAHSANTNANASASPMAAEAANPVDKEKRVWEEFKAKDWAAFSTDLADEFIEVEPTGVYTKASAVEGLKQMDASKYTLSDWKETKIDADASVVTYHVKSADGKEEGNHATVWAKRGERWWAFLHQGTPVVKK
ncbi:MAG TPA: nuclear transport factor 2 family protein [Pyrinomonadaceae bacterium]|jgi:hypothetical protein|nr:nuclear transport factor 2 family protein [Pyrinomonadaceae bacterium]